MFGVAVGTMALVIVLSVFNGLEDLIRSLHNFFDPELKIEAVIGKSFEVDDAFLSGIKNTEGVAILTQVIEDDAYVKFKDSEMIVKLKGVDENFIEHHRIDERIVQGQLKLKENGINYALIGRGVQYALSIHQMTNMYAMQFYYPKRGKVSSINPGDLYRHKGILPAGVFAIEKQYDISYVFVPLDFAIDLLDYGNRRTSIEIKVKEGYDIETVKQNLKHTLGDKFRVLTSEELHSSFLKVLKVEKLFVFIIFSLILAVASFNIFFSLTMLAIEKKKDIAILYSFGATNKLIRKIFIMEGAIISFIGAVVGLIIGLLVCVAQQQFGIVSMGMQTAVLEAYPVKMLFPDFLYTALSIIIITLLASFRPAVIATKVNAVENL